MKPIRKHDYPLANAIEKDGVVRITLLTIYLFYLSYGMADVMVNSITTVQAAKIRNLAIKFDALPGESSKSYKLQNSRLASRTVRYFFKRIDQQKLLLNFFATVSKVLHTVSNFFHDDLTVAIIETFPVQN